MKIFMNRLEGPEVMTGEMMKISRTLNTMRMRKKQKAISGVSNSFTKRSKLRKLLTRQAIAISRR